MCVCLVGANYSRANNIFRKLEKGRTKKRLNFSPFFASPFTWQSPQAKEGLFFLPLLLQLFVLPFLPSSGTRHTQAPHSTFLGPVAGPPKSKGRHFLPPRSALASAQGEEIMTSTRSSDATLEIKRFPLQCKEAATWNAP